MEKKISKEEARKNHIALLAGAEWQDKTIKAIQDEVLDYYGFSNWTAEAGICSNHVTLSGVTAGEDFQELTPSLLALVQFVASKNHARVVISCKDNHLVITFRHFDAHYDAMVYEENHKEELKAEGY